MKASGGRDVRLAHLGFAIGALVVAMMGWTLHAALSRTVQADRRVDHTREVLRAIDAVHNALARMEAAQATYLLLGEHAERAPALAALRAAPDRVAALTADNPSQQARTRALRDSIERRIAVAERNAARRRAEGIDAVRLAMASGSAKRASEEIAALTRDMESEELRLLQARRDDERRQVELARTVLLAALLIIAAVLLPAYGAFVRQTRRRQLIEDMLHDLVESLPVTVYRMRSVADGSLRTEFLGGGLENVRGQPSEALLRDPKLLWRTIVDEDRPGVIDAVRQAQATLAPFDREYRIRDADGTLRWVHSQARLHRQADGSVLWNGYWADITERKRLQEAFRQAKEEADTANRAKGVFLATMSHELRTPLHGVLGTLELLALTRLDGEQRTAVGVIRESGRSLMRIIDDILDFSKIEAGRLALRPEVASVSRVVERTYQIYRGIASSKGLHIDVAVDPQVSPALSFDPLRLGQILNNLLSNALKFTAQGGVGLAVRRLARSDDGHETLAISVADSGIGIAADKQDKLFQPFTQADEDTDRTYGGTGLGLAICRRLAEMMGGRIEMQSEPGRGTTVTLTVTLPVADAGRLPRITEEGRIESLAATLAGRRAVPTVEQARADGSLVLVVDDHPTNQAVLLRQIQALGYAAESAGDGVEALERWRSGRFGLVITDCNMPRMNGYDLARSIRRLESASRDAGRRIPIIACTANALGGEAETCLAAGMDDCLAKPVGINELMQVLDRWLPLAAAATAQAVPPAAPDAPAASEPLKAPKAPQRDAAAADDEPPLRHAMLAAAVQGKADLRDHVLQVYRRTTDDDAAALRAAMDGRDAASAARLAHRIKGASRTVGADPLARVCEQLEQAGKRGDWAALEDRMAAFEVGLKQLKAYLDAP